MKPVELPPRPVAPEPGDRCGGGCALCVLDLYQQQLAQWEEQVAQIERAVEEAAKPI